MIVVDPSNYDKQDAWKLAKDFAAKFIVVNCANGIDDVPTFNDSSELNVRRAGPLKVEYGFYESIGHDGKPSINVNLKKSRRPVKIPGFQWSYTGFKADLTIPGITAHEVGHHVHTVMGYSYGRRDVVKLVNMMDLGSEPRVSSYEPNPFETFAEAMRLFILNPALLREGRPRRFKMLNQTLGLIPIVDVGWREILVNAHPRIIKAAENWIEKGRNV